MVCRCATIAPASGSELSGTAPVPPSWTMTRTLPWAIADCMSALETSVVSAVVPRLASARMTHDAIERSTDRRARFIGVDPADERIAEGLER